MMQPGLLFTLNSFAFHFPRSGNLFTGAPCIKCIERFVQFCRCGIDCSSNMLVVHVQMFYIKINIAGSKEQEFSHELPVPIFPVNHLMGNNYGACTGMNSV